MPVLRLLLLFILLLLLLDLLLLWRGDARRGRGGGRREWARVRRARRRAIPFSARNHGALASAPFASPFLRSCVGSPKLATTARPCDASIRPRAHASCHHKHHAPPLTRSARAIFPRGARPPLPAALCLPPCVLHECWLHSSRRLTFSVNHGPSQASTGGSHSTFHVPRLRLEERAGRGGCALTLHRRSVVFVSIL